MKFAYSLFFLTAAVSAEPLPSDFPLRADNQYALDMQSILTQFSGFTQPSVLKSYESFMIMVKHFLDLGFRLRVLENKMTSPQRSLLRTPMQNYNTCRTALNADRAIPFQYPSYEGQQLSSCDQQYAIEVQQVIKGLIPTTDSGTVQEYQNFMIMLKNYEDLRYKINNFEKITPLETIAKLRGPMKRYENSIDGLIRSYDR